MLVMQTNFYPAAERGHTNIGWLNSRHSFSFGHFRDPSKMGYRDLRVINDDRVAGGGGFPPHDHADMEIVTFVLSGALAHGDSLGHQSIIRPGEIQAMSAGTGIEHSEFNASADDPVHFLQIWLYPAKRGLPPSYAQKNIANLIDGKLGLIASNQPSNTAITIHQDVRLYAAQLAVGQAIEFALPAGRHGWLQLATGALQQGDQALVAGDAQNWADSTPRQWRATADSTLLLFDLA